MSNLHSNPGFTPTSSGGEVASLDDTRWKEDLGVLGMDGLQPGRTLQVTCLGLSGGPQASDLA